jgi:hypothetical protein
MNTCGRCQFCVTPYGEKKGYCYGVPPSVYASGAEQVNPPMVKHTRPACSLFQPLPDDAPIQVKEKVDLHQRDVRRMEREQRKAKAGNLALDLVGGQGCKVTTEIIKP